MNIPPYVLQSDSDRLKTVSDAQLNQEWQDATSDPAVRAMMRLQAIENERRRRTTPLTGKTTRVKLSDSRHQKSLWLGPTGWAYFGTCIAAVVVVLLAIVISYLTPTH